MKRRNYSELEKTRNRKQMRAFVREVAEFYANTDNEISKPYITNYYQITDSCYYKILEYAVIWGVVDDITVKRMEEKTCFNARLHSGSCYRTESKYAELKRERKEYSKFPFSKKEVINITKRFAGNSLLTKKELAKEYEVSINLIDNALYVAIVENLVKDEIFQKIKERSLKANNSEKAIAFFEEIEALRKLNKESS